MTPCVVLDTETTGLPNNGAGHRGRIIELGAVVVTADARVVSPISFFVRQPESHLTSRQARRAMRVHGIGVAQILREGLAPRDAAPRLARWIDRVRDRFGVTEVRAYNQSFDFWFLERSPWDLFGRTGLARGEDIKATAKTVMKVRSGPALEKAVAFANARGGDLSWIGTAHRAGEDARVAACLAVTLERLRADERGMCDAG